MISLFDAPHTAWHYVCVYVLFVRPECVCLCFVSVRTLDRQILFFVHV